MEQLFDNIDQRISPVAHQRIPLVSVGENGACVFYNRTLTDGLNERKQFIKEYVERSFGYNLSRSLDEIRPSYKFGVSCQGSVPEAIIAFLEAETLEDCARKAVSLGGDSDTIAAMACSIFAAGKEGKTLASIELYG